MLERFGVGRCCCEWECWIWSDDFNRGDNLDPGDDWNESRGDANGFWEIKDQRLHEPSEPESSSTPSVSSSTSSETSSSSSSALSEESKGSRDRPTIIGTNPEPLRSRGQQYITVTIIQPEDSSSTSSSQSPYSSSSSCSTSSSSSSTPSESTMTMGTYTIYPCCKEDDRLGPVHVEFTHLGGYEWHIGIWHQNTLKGEAYMTHAPIGFGDEWFLYVCAEHSLEAGGGGMVKAGVSSVGDEPAWADDCDPGDGRYYGLGHGRGTIGAWFDDFTVMELRAGTKKCSPCFCYCLTYPPRKQLHGEFVNAINRAACMGGIGWDMDWRWDVGEASWHGIAEVPATDDGGEDTDFPFVLRCESYGDDDPTWPGRNFTLSWEFSTPCCTGNPGGCTALFRPIAELSTCEPLHLVFGPFYLRCDDLTCSACWPPLSPDVSGIIGPNCDPDDPDVLGEYYIVITE